jgi:hypothetical protein
MPPIPSSITDLSTTAALNSPAGSDNLSTADDYLRAVQGIVKTVYTDASARTETLTNKTVNLTSNTLVGTTAQFNTALSDGDFATLAGSETLTNKALNGTLGATTPSTVVATDLTTTGIVTMALTKSIFAKDNTTVAFTKTGAGTATTSQALMVAIGSTVYSYASSATVVMPTLTAGTDYAIYACTDGTVRADASFTAPSGYTISNSRQIGGFHYAPGGNAAAQAGGDTTAAINAYSLWDLKFRPACSDPRGMALIADDFWADIYLLGVDYLTNGSSKYNVSIADGSAPPKRSTLYGGNGTLTYADGNWWNLNEALKHVGKRSPTYSEFAALAYGTTEATSSGGTDVPTTGVSGTGATSAWNLFTSKFGVIQATGCMWIWGDEFGGPYGTTAYTANTQSRGSTYNLSNAVLLGGLWSEAAASGSRASFWNASPPVSNTSVGARGVCDHLTLV